MISGLCKEKDKRKEIKKGNDKKVQGRKLEGIFHKVANGQSFIQVNMQKKKKKKGKNIESQIHSR